MSTQLEINKKKLFKKRLTILDTSTRAPNSNKTNISSKVRGSQLIQNYSKIVLPSININFTKNKRKTILEPESLFSKFLGNYKPTYSDKVDKIQQPTIQLNKIESRKSIMIRSQSLNSILIPTRKEFKFKSQRLFVTEKNKNKINFLNINLKNNLLDKIKENIFEEEKKNNENNKGEENIDNENIKYEKEKKEEPLFDDKGILIINNNTQQTNTQQQNTNASTVITKINKTNIYNNKISTKSLKTLNLSTSSSHSSSLLSNNFNTNYKRLRKFKNVFLQKEEKESQNNINIKNEQNLIMRLYENNIQFQAKIFDEQIRLLNGVYKEYKLIYFDKTFMEVFKSKNLFTKIKYNKALEETCSILYYLPKFILREWYDLLFNLEKIKIPSQKKFISDYITDENDTVKNNNHLLTEVINYFNKCAEFYLMLSKKENESADVKFTQKIFFKIIKYIKTARYNIIYLINSFNNSKKKFLDDLTIIKKFLIRNNNLNEINNINTTESEISFSKKLFNNFLLLENEKNKNIDAIEKIEEQFIYKREDEAQKIKQIEDALDIHKRKPIYNHLGKIVIRNKNNYKSIFLNKYMNKVLNYCFDDIKDQIINEKVNDQDEENESFGYNIKSIKSNFNKID